MSTFLFRIEKGLAQKVITNVYSEKMTQIDPRARPRAKWLQKAVNRDRKYWFLVSLNEFQALYLSLMNLD